MLHRVRMLNSTLHNSAFCLPHPLSGLVSHLVSLTSEVQIQSRHAFLIESETRNTGSLSHSPEVQRTTLLGDKPFYILHLEWGKTTGRMQPHLEQHLAVRQPKVPKQSHGNKTFSRLSVLHQK